MDPVEKATVIRFHRDRLRLSPLKAQGWRSADSQQKRFEVLCGIGDLEGCKVLDLGCGYGDLKTYVDSHFHGVSYLGVDHLPEFIDEARQYHGEGADTGFVCADFLNAILPQADYVLASGALGYRSRNQLHPFSIIGQMWQACTRGVAFNLLDARHFEADEVLCGHHPDAILDYCRRFDPQAELITGYLPDDFTIFLRRRQP
jgi:SAM-dependent methyltransferase